MDRDLVIVLDRVLSGERFFSLSLFGRSKGPFRGMVRRSRQRMPPDHFDSGVAEWGRSRRGGDLVFIDDFQFEKRRSGIARDWDRMRTAARLGMVFFRNGNHLEDPAEAFAICQRALDWLNEPCSSGAVYLKALYRFAREEGFAVKQGWWSDLNPPDRDRAKAILQSPIPAVDPAICQGPSMDELVGSLERWLSSEAGFVFPSQ